MQSINLKKAEQSQWKHSLRLKRDVASLKNVRLLLKLLKFLDGNQAGQLEKQ